MCYLFIFSFFIIFLFYFYKLFYIFLSEFVLIFKFYLLYYLFLYIMNLQLYCFVFNIGGRIYEYTFTNQKLECIQTLYKKWNFVFKTRRILYKRYLSAHLFHEGSQLLLLLQKNCKLTLIIFMMILFYLLLKIIQIRKIKKKLIHY